MERATRSVIKEQTTLSSLGDGISFLRRTPILLAAITLDLFAVLLGGATNLLPIFAKDILQVGADGLGWLRAIRGYWRGDGGFCVGSQPTF